MAVVEPWWCLIAKKFGRKLKDYSQQIANMTNIPLNDRTCFRSTFAATGIPVTRLHSTSIVASSGTIPVL
jgi:hypothetical protein